VLNSIQVVLKRMTVEYNGMQAKYNRILVAYNP